MFKCPFAIELTLYSEEINEQDISTAIEQILTTKFGHSFPVVRVMTGKKIDMSEQHQKIWRAKRQKILTDKMYQPM